VGAWRSTRDEAVDDAIRSRQAALREGGEDLDWLVPGTIEGAIDLGGDAGIARPEDAAGSG
jgi:hypothetical protein